ncbi:hypothetical protein L2D01_11085 [Hyphomonadaceae bacterium ML37]|nr:hypothetical protein L2D01_11085 [Hyphomonadaceae bacterium ML37]
MARLCEDGAARFVILDGDQLYETADIDRLCARHAISDAHRGAVWRLLESAGRALLDQRRLHTTPVQLARIRQDLLLGLRVTRQLADLTPRAGQCAGDQPSATLSRAHLAALREGERRAGGGAGAGSRLEEAHDTLAWLAEVYESAIESCARVQREGQDPDGAWRATLTRFFTRTLARSWTDDGGAAGERFLADCMAVLEARDAPAPVLTLRLASDT